MRPKIMIVLPSFGVGGVEVRTARIVNALKPEFDFEIVSLDGRKEATAFLTDGIPVTGWPRGFGGKNMALQILRCRRALVRSRPHLLFTYNWGSFEWWVAARWAGVCPHIHGEDGFSDEETRAPKIRRQLLRRMFLKHCARVVMPSKKLLHSALWDWGLLPQTASYIPNGVDVQKYGRPKWRKGNKTTLVCIASLTPVKNHLRLLRAFVTARSRRVPMELLLAGKGPEEAAIRHFVESHGLSNEVRILGHRSDVSSLLAQSDCLCLSSDSEQMPVSVLEGMAAECAVLSTDVGDVAEMVCEENRRFIVPKDDFELFASRMEELARKSDLRKKIGRKNRERCGRLFSEDTMIESYRNLFWKTLVRPGPKS